MFDIKVYLRSSMVDEFKKLIIKKWDMKNYEQGLLLPIMKQS